MGKDLKGKELGVGLNQRKDGRYQARFTKSNGQRSEKNFVKITEAREWLNKQRYLDSITTTGDMTVDEWYNFWIENYKEGIVKDNTTRNYKQRYEYNIKKEIGGIKLQDVKQLHCQKILNNMFSSGRYSNGTMELTQITLHALFKGAVENDYLQKNPAENLKLKHRDNDSEERRVLTREEQKIFKEYSQNTLYNNAYCLVLETGLRAGEIGGLQWNDIDFDKKVIYVQRTILQDAQKGGFYFGEPKTKKSKRKIPLTNEAISILNNQKLMQSKLKMRSKNWNNDWDGLVFTTINGNPVGSSTFRSMMIRIVKNINFDRQCNVGSDDYEEFEHCYMHSLRHTFATRCIENGIQPKTLQKILGHSTLSTTMDLYVHVTDDQIFSEMNKMNNVI
ncbi:MAG: tyrosine-type recombinase/integrase [Lachnospiraceae bacterium]|nr:tyrosine-type recombinase/integrase [Lachnospiraceae bacterium]